MREVKFKILTEPLSKQSVRVGRRGFYQHKKYKKAKTAYQLSIKSQLPADFKLFTKKVYITKAWFVHSATKTMLRTKKGRKFFEEGGLKEKTTRPDLPDNLQKLILDSMSGIIYKDDSLICRQDNLRKYYGIEPYIEIHLLGE